MGMLALCREKFGTAYMHPEKRHKAVFGLMWSVIGEVFYLFVYYFILFFHFFLFSTNQLLVRLGIGVLPPYPNNVKDMHPELCVIGEVFYLFVYIFYFLFLFIFFLFSTNQLLVLLGVLGFCLLTPTV